MTLKVYSPVKIVFEGKVDSVSVPGFNKPFVILKGHAPIVSVLTEGTISYVSENNNEATIEIKDGLLEVREDVITICVQLKH